MGAEAEGNPPSLLAAGEPATAARAQAAQPITAEQFLSWKQRKPMAILTVAKVRPYDHSDFAHATKPKIPPQNKIPILMLPPRGNQLANKPFIDTGILSQPIGSSKQDQIKDAEEAARKAEAAQKRAADIASGAVQMNGRELFQHEPWVFDNNIY
ncbi:hypothetical protein ACP70R_012269 [Stipagrostis hirtigluma subsp. patula]